MPKDKEKDTKGKGKGSPNPNFVPCGQGEEKGLKLTKLKVRSGDTTEFRFIACAAPIQVNVRLDFHSVLEKQLPDSGGSNEARYLLPGNLVPGKEYVVDWFYDSPVAIDKWATTTEASTAGAVIFRHHKRADGKHPYRLGVVILEVA